MFRGFLKQSTASQTRTIGPFIDDSDAITPTDALTIANTDIRVKKNGAADAAKNSGGGTADVNGMYAVTWDATDTNTVGELQFSIKVAGALYVGGYYWVLEEAVYDAIFGASASLLMMLAANAVTATAIASDAITDTKIASGALTAAKFAASAITSTVLADNAITANKINADAITNAKIADNAIAAENIAADAITNAKIADNAIAAENIAADAIAAAKIATGAITSAKFAADAITATVIADNAITAGKIATAALVSAKFSEADPPPSNVVEVNDVVVAGTGTEVDPWGPA